MRLSGDRERPRRRNAALRPDAEFARAGLGIRVHDHIHKEDLPERGRHLQRVLANVDVAFDGFQLAAVKLVERVPPGVDRPFVHARRGIRRQGGTRGIVAHDDSVQPLLQPGVLRRRRRCGKRHPVDRDHLHAFARDAGIELSPESLPADHQTVRRSGLDTGRIDVAHVRTGRRGRRNGQRQRRRRCDSKNIEVRHACFSSLPQLTTNN